MEGKENPELNERQLAVKAIWDEAVAEVGPRVEGESKQAWKRRVKNVVFKLKKAKGHEKEKGKKKRKKRKSRSSHRPSKDEWRQAEECGVTVVIDCAYDELMADKEKRSLGKQIWASYAANCRLSRPFKLVITSIDKEKSIPYQKLLETGVANWGHFEVQEKDWREVYPDDVDDDKGDQKQKKSKKRIIYLVGEAEEALDASVFDQECVLIVGGLVDRNRHKATVYTKALGKNVEMRRLPIEEHITLKSSKILTTLHVVEIISKMIENRDWSEALSSVIPSRKLKAQKAE